MDTSVAVSLSAASLGVAVTIAVWQIVLYRLSGPRLRLQVRPGVMNHRHQLAIWDREWPSESPRLPGWHESDLWVEVVELVVTNRGRVPVWISDVGISFRTTRWRPRQEPLTVTLRPLAVNGGLADGSPVRLETGQPARMYVAIFNTVDWAEHELGEAVHFVRCTARVVGYGTRLSKRRRSWLIGEGQDFPHRKVGRPTQIYRELLKVWPTADISDLYEAALQTMVALGTETYRQHDQSSSKITTVLEPFIPNLLDRTSVAIRLQGIGIPDDPAMWSMTEFGQGGLSDERSYH